MSEELAMVFPDTDLPHAVLTGNPVRDDVRTLDVAASRADARVRCGVADDRVLVAAFGGSLGARRINDAVLGLAEQWSDRHDVAVRHVIGERDWERYSSRVDALGGSDRGLRYDAVRYEHGMASLYAAADVVVCRSGASSVAELAVVGRAAVFVPLPGAPGDHQTANARAMVDVGGAVLVPDADLDAGRLAAVLDPLVRDPARIVQMGRAAATLARPDAARTVALLVEEIAHG